AAKPIEVARADARAARARWTWPSLVALVILVAVAGISFWIGGRGGPALGIGAAGRPAIVVMPFENPSSVPDTQWLTAGLPSLLVTSLGQTPGLDVVGNQRVDEVLRDIGQKPGSIDRGHVLEVGRRAGAGAAIVGSVFKQGAEVRIDLQVQ